MKLAQRRKGKKKIRVSDYEFRVREFTTKSGTAGRLVGTTHEAVVLTLPSVQKGTGFPGKPFFPGAPEKVLEGFVTGRSSRFFSAYTTETNAVMFSCNSP